MNKFLRWVWMIVLSFAVAACGGGGGSSGTSVFDSSSSSGSSSGSTSSSAALSISLSTSTVTASSPATVTVVAKNASGSVQAGVVVAFTVTNSKGTLSQTSALTDASGMASVTLSPASGATSGADTVVASATINSTAVTASAGFSLTATSVAVSSFTSDVGTSSTSKLSAYGQAVLTLSLTGVSSSNPATVTFTSSCIASKKATISSSSVTNTTGTVTLTYQDNGCGATSTTDTVSATVSGSTTPVSITLYPASPSANAISFVSASPTSIYLKGSGLTESSTVMFQVNDTASNALPNQSVTLSLTTFTGGLLLDGSSSSVTKTTDSNGQVTVKVSAGTVPTPVRVLASLASGVSTVSSSLAVAVGLPTQVAFSLAQTTINIEGGSIDGTSNTYTVYAADRSGNPVPAGTAITFWSEGGQVVGSSLTALNNGIASATAAFVSQSPRPADGRVTVLAYAIGEESFKDLNGNNVWDSGEPFQDLGDVVKDIRYDGSYESGNDEYVSLSGTNSAGTQTCSDFSSTYSILAVGRDIPSRAATCDATWTQRTYVRRAVETVLSTSSARLHWASTSSVNGSCPSMTLKTSGLASDAGSTFYPVTSSGTWFGGSSGTIAFIVADANTVRLNPMPAGTTVEASSKTTGLTAEIAGGGTVPNTSTASGAVVSYSFTDTAVTSGLIQVSVKSPSGLVTQYLVTVRNTGSTPSCS